jgi:hypothetical protein
MINKTVTDKKLAANRSNALRSSGPKSERGKNHSRRNSLKHGVLASALLIKAGEGAEVPAEFNELFAALNRDLKPVGRLEEMMIEKIAVCWWRQKRAAQCEAGLISRSFLPNPGRDLEESLHWEVGLGPCPEQAAPIKDHLRLPLSADLDRILRYEATIQRQLVFAINELERLQRARQGETLPAPINIQLSSDR